MAEVLEEQQQPLGKEGRKDGLRLSWVRERGTLFFCWDLGVLGVPGGCFSGPNKGQVTARGTVLLGSAGGHRPPPGVGDRAHFCCTAFISMIL